MKLNKTIFLSLFIVILMPFSQASARGYGGSYTRSYDVHFKNVSDTVLTPPILALCPYKIEPLAKIGYPASVALEKLAEGGMTGDIADIFIANNCSYEAATAPVMPGSTFTATLSGSKFSYGYAASMILPSNDGFVAVSGMPVYKLLWKGGYNLAPYDSGTEANDELCANIPDACPPGGGVGYNPDRSDANNFVKGHPGIHGNGEIDPAMRSLSNPTAIFSIY